MSVTKHSESSSPQMNGKTPYASGSEDLIMLRYQSYPRGFPGSIYFLSKSQWLFFFFRNKISILKLIWNFQRP
jgi:hypothetical protein